MPTTTFRVLFFHIPTHSQLMIEEYNYSRKKNKNQAHFSRGSTLQQKWSWLPWQESLSRALSQSSTAAWCTKLEHPSQLGQVSDQIWNKFTCKSRQLFFRDHHGLLGWHISNIGSPVVTPEKKIAAIFAKCTFSSGGIRIALIMHSSFHRPTSHLFAFRWLPCSVAQLFAVPD